MHLSPLAFGWIGLFVGGGSIISKLLSPLLIRHHSVKALFCWGLIAILAAGLILAGGLLAGALSVTLLIVTVMCSTLGQGLSCPNTSALAMPPYRHIGGAANALMSAMQMGLSFVLSFTLSTHIFEAHQAWGLCSAYVLIGCLTLAVYCGFQRMSTS